MKGLFLVYILTGILVGLFSYAAGETCPAGCPTSCVQSSFNLTADIVDGKVYIGFSNFSETQNGTYENPFLSLQLAMEALQNVPDNVTIIFLEGEHYVTTQYQVTDGFSGVVSYNPLNPRSGITTLRFITITSETNSNLTTIICDASSTNFLTVSAVLSTNILSLNLIVKNLTFTNCNEVFNFGGESLTVTNCNFYGPMNAAVNAYNSYIINFSSLLFIDVVNELSTSNVFLSYFDDLIFKHTEVFANSIGNINLYRELTFMPRNEAYISYCYFSNTSNSNVLNENVYADVSDCYIRASHGPALSYYLGSGTVERVNFTDFIYEVDAMLDLAASNVTATDCYFLNSDSLNFGPILLSQSSNASVYSSYIINVRNPSKDPDAFYTQESSLYIYDCYVYSFEGFLAQVGYFGDLIPAYLELNNLRIDDSIFEGESLAVLQGNLVINGMIYENSFQTEQIAIFCSGGTTCYLNDVIFTNNNDTSAFSCGFIYAAPMSLVVVDHMTASENSGISGTVICGMSNSEIVVKNSDFVENYAEQVGGAIACYGCNLTIINTTFTGNTAGDVSTSTVGSGGALYWVTSPGRVNAFGTCSNCTFESNTASYGGAVYVEVGPVNPIVFEYPKFTKNFAINRGAAIYSGVEKYFPTVTAPVFTGNVAQLSGDDYAGPAIKLVWTSGAQPISPNNVSGYYLPDFIVTLLDSYGTTVFLPDTECLILEVTIAAVTGNGGAVAIGEIEKAIIQGQVTFSDIRVVGLPGDYTVYIQSNVSSFPASQFYMTFPVSVLDCPLGMVTEALQGSPYGICVEAICSGGCIYGICIGNNTCQCNASYTGDSCQYLNSPPYYPDYPQPAAIVIGIITGILIGLLLFFAITVWVFKDTPVFKSASPIFCLITLFGMLLGYLSVFTFIGEPSTALCTSNLWLINVAFAVAFAAVVAKNWRVYQIFENKQLRVKSVQTRGLLTWVSIIVSIEVVLLIIWSGYDAPGEVVINGLAGTRYIICGSHVSAKFSLALLIIIILYNAAITFGAAWLAFKTRNVSSAFRDSTGIALSVYNFAVISIIVLPLIYLSEDTFSPEAIFLVKSISVLFVITFAMLTLYGPKVYIVYLAKGRNILPRDSLMKNTSEISKARNEVSREMSVVTAISLQNPIENLQSISGKMAMQTGPLRLWRSRYVQLHAPSGLVTIFEDESRNKPGLAFAVANVSIENRDDLNPGCFAILTAEGAFILQTQDKTASTQWIGAINQVRSKFFKEAEKKREGNTSQGGTLKSERENSITENN